MRTGPVVWREQDTDAALFRRYDQEAAVDLRPRWHALWLLRRGRPRSDVADVLGINPRTLRDWIAWYRQGGCDCVARHRQGMRKGKAPWLTPEQLGQIRELAAQGQFQRIAEVGEWVKETFRVTYTYWGIRSVLDRLQIHPHVPRPLGAKADPLAQDAWKKGGCAKPLSPKG